MAIKRKVSENGKNCTFSRLSSTFILIQAMLNSEYKVKIDSTELVFTEGCNAFPQFEITLDVVNEDAIKDKIRQYQVSEDTGLQYSPKNPVPWIFFDSKL